MILLTTLMDQTATLAMDQEVSEAEDLLRGMRGEVEEEEAIVELIQRVT